MAFRATKGDEDRAAVKRVMPASLARPGPDLPWRRTNSSHTDERVSDTGQADLIFAALLYFTELSLAG
jgi:hypothetical protein